MAASEWNEEGKGRKKLVNKPRDTSQQHCNTDMSIKQIHTMNTNNLKFRSYVTLLRAHRSQNMLGPPIQHCQKAKWTSRWQLVDIINYFTQKNKINK